MKRIILIVTGVLALLIFFVLSTRIRKDINKKLQFENTYAIQNVATGKALRPKDANYENGVDLIAYPVKDWECITWEMIEIDSSTFLLKDLFTEKTFQPKSTPGEGVGLWQQSLGGTPLQYWEFLKQTDGNFMIRLKGTELYLTTSSNETNSPIVLKSKENSNRQVWKLIKQTPWI